MLNGNGLHESWIDQFVEATDSLPSPQIFRKWAAIGAVAGVLERKVWTSTYGIMTTYAHMYIILTGPPGTGKSVAIEPVETMWREIAAEGDGNPMLDFKIAPTSMTRASLTDTLSQAKREFVVPGVIPPQIASYNSLLVPQSELGNMMPSYDSEFILFLTRIFDCRPFEERKRVGNINISVPNPQLHILGGTTPSFLGKYFAEGTWDQGFTSRAMLIFSAETFRTNPFAFVDNKLIVSRLATLKQKLKAIGTLFGSMSWSPDAIKAYWYWIESGEPPVPEHTKLQYYLPRRKTHLQKLAMVACVARSQTLFIELEDYQTALGWLLEAEAYMGDIFMSMNTSGDGELMEDAYIYMMKESSRLGGLLPQRMLFSFLKDRTPAHNISRVAEIMLRSGMIEAVVDDSKVYYKPRPSMEHKRV